jgi:hypothetical protein
LGEAAAVAAASDEPAAAGAGAGPAADGEGLMSPTSASAILFWIAVLAVSMASRRARIARPALMCQDNTQVTMSHTNNSANRALILQLKRRALRMSPG